MGNIFSRKKYCRIEAKTLEETPFSYYTEVSSTLRNTRVESVTDETCGSASNLIKVEEPNTEFTSVQEESRDGWIVKRHVDIASVTIRLCEATYIFGFDVDTTGFENICPTHSRIEGLKTPIEDNNEEWITLVDTESIIPNSHNFFQKNTNDEVLYSHVRLTISPGGGIARFRTYGDIVPCYLNPETEYNLASASLGARIVRWSDTDNTNEPNVLLDKGTLSTHGWLTPRSHKTDRNDFIVIQLATSGMLNSIVVDTTGYKGNSPLKVRVEGCDSKEDDPYLDVYTQWFSLVPESSINEDALNTFEVSYTDIVSHVRLTLIPDGGLQQIKCLGTVPNDLMVQSDSVQALTNTASNEQEIINLMDTTEEEMSTAKEDLNSSIEASSVADIEGLDPNRPTISYFGVCNNIPMTPSSSQETSYTPSASQKPSTTKGYAPIAPRPKNESNCSTPNERNSYDINPANERQTSPSYAYLTPKPESPEMSEKKDKKELNPSPVTTVTENATMESLYVCKEQYAPTIAPMEEEPKTNTKKLNDNDPMEEDSKTRKRKIDDNNSINERSKIPRRYPTTSSPSPYVNPKTEDPMDFALAGPSAIVKRGRGRPRKAKK